MPEPNHTEKIKSQVLAKVGTPPRMQRVEVSKHHNGKYRVNIWEQPELATELCRDGQCPDWAVLLFDGVGNRRDHRQQSADD